MRMPRKIDRTLKDSKSAHRAFIFFMYSRAMQVWESGESFDLKWNIWNPIGLFMWILFAIIIFIFEGTRKFRHYGENNGFFSEYWKENKCNFLIPTREGLFWESEL